MAGTSILWVPYRGGAPAMQDLIAGHIDLLVIQQQKPEGLAAFQKAEIER